jgi:hypothetical protein
MIGDMTVPFIMFAQKFGRLAQTPFHPLLALRISFTLNNLEGL